MSPSIVLGIIRHLLTVSGGYLVAQGSLTNGQLSEAVGALVTLLGIGWSVWEKRRQQQHPTGPHDRTPFTGAILAAGLALIAAAAFGSGCASPERVTRAEIEVRCGTNTVTVSQPKDTIIDKLEFDPNTGKLTLHGYQSTASAAAVEATRAQAAAQANVVSRSLDVIESLSARAAAAYGIPTGPARSVSPTPSTAPASGLRFDLAPKP